MSNETKKTALPKLRFPEFEEAGEWETELFKDLYSFKGTNSFSRDKLNYEGGTVKNIHYGDIHTKFSTLFDIKKEKVPFVNSSVAVDKVKEENYCVEGDMIFADASEDLNDIGKSIEVVKLNGEKVLSGLHTQFARQKTQKLVVGFAGHLFTSDAIRAQIQNEAQGTKVLGISAGRLSKIEVCYPGDKREQQKIAATLSSLDDLITAQNAKLAALQAHKRGLMQGLFPAEGETVPKLRFPEFLEAGEWKRVKLSTQVELISGLHLSPDGYAAQGDIPYFSGPSDFTNDLPQVSKWTLQSTNIGRVGDTLITVKGSGAGGLFQLIIEEVALGRQLMAVRAIAAHAGFISHFLATQKQRLESLATGNLIPGLSRVDILGLNVMIPLSAEQQKVAATLTSLDNRITAQVQKIEALKLHKKGLMQNLFPAAAEPTV